MKRSTIQFSIVIPTYNRPRELTACLASIVKIDYPADRFEVIVVNDGGAEPLNSVVKSFGGGPKLTLVRQPNGGPGSARNTGARMARGRYLAFTDDDCRPDPAWLRKVEARLEHAPDRMIGGRTINCLTDNPYTTASQMIVDAVYAHYNKDAEAAQFFASNNMIVPAGLFQKIGGFDTAFTIASEDRELCDRWLHLGYGMTYVSDAVVLHAHRLTLRGFCRQHFSYGRGALQYQRLRAHRGSGRMREDMVFHARLLRLLAEPMAKRSLANAATVGALLVLWQLVNGAGFVYQMCRRQEGAPGVAKEEGCQSQQKVGD